MANHSIRPLPDEVRHGFLTIVRRLPPKKGNSRVLCRCDCGKEVDVATRKVVSGNTRSCGCYRRKVSCLNARRHGRSHDRTYLSWSSMRTRCTNSRSESWPDYGGRGITVCERWSSFANFLEDMGTRPLGKTLDRIDPNGNYEPSNCRWATLKEQAQNKRRGSH